MRILVVITLIVSMFFGSCKHFEKKSLFKKDVDNLVEKNREKDSIIRADSIKMAELKRMNQHLNLTIDSLESLYESDRQFEDTRFFMIVGSFHNPNYADKWAEKIGHMGYNTQIIKGRGNFKMVAAKGYNNFRTAVDDIDHFRSRVVDNAWVYVNK